MNEQIQMSWLTVLPCCRENELVDIQSAIDTQRLCRVTVASKELFEKAAAPRKIFNGSLYECVSCVWGRPLFRSPHDGLPVSRAANL